MAEWLRPSVEDKTSDYGQQNLEFHTSGRNYFDQLTGLLARSFT